MNVDLLRKVQVQIISEPQNFDMTEWAKPLGKPRGTFAGFDLGVARCGTSACIAGWAITLSGGDAVALDDEVSPVATSLLELTDEQADELFYIESWPADLYAFYRMAQSVSDHARMAQVAVEAIDRFIDNHSVTDNYLASASSGDNNVSPPRSGV